MVLYGCTITIIMEKDMNTDVQHPGINTTFSLTNMVFYKQSYYCHCYCYCAGSSTLDEYNNHAAAAAKSLQSCLTLCDPIDSSPPGSPVPGILQARTLEWVAISFSNA